MNAENVWIAVISAVVTGLGVIFRWFTSAQKNREDYTQEQSERILKYEINRRKEVEENLEASRGRIEEMEEKHKYQMRHYRKLLRQFAEELRRRTGELKYFDQIDKLP